MVIDLIQNALLSFLQLAIQSLALTLVVFLLVYWIGRRGQAFFRNRGYSWVTSAFLTSYLTVFVLLILAFFIPIWSAGLDSQLGLPPREIQWSLSEQLGLFFFSLVRLALLAALFALLSLPLLFCGAFVREYLLDHIPSKIAPFFLATWVMVMLTVAISLFWLTWVPASLLYLIYWA